MGINLGYVADLDAFIGMNLDQPELEICSESGTVLKI
jgi:hypothetical protein